MNAYFVKTKDEREYVVSILDDGTGPTLVTWPMAPVVAETPNKAKVIFLKEFPCTLRAGLEADDYPNLRVRLLKKNVEQPEGLYEDNTEFWWHAVRIGVVEGGVYVQGVRE